MTADRRPFFVMELVNGLPLAKFCDEAKLGIRQRLELFDGICQVVQHAHQKGIFHRTSSRGTSWSLSSTPGRCPR
jgi:eukaryotic-like serine/threonine-protein kinase